MGNTAPLFDHSGEVVETTIGLQASRRYDTANNCGVDLSSAGLVDDTRVVSAELAIATDPVRGIIFKLLILWA